jgi:hypothetical protein
VHDGGSTVQQTVHRGHVEDVHPGQIDDQSREDVPIQSGGDRRGEAVGGVRAQLAYHSEDGDAGPIDVGGNAQGRHGEPSLTIL